MSLALLAPAALALGALAVLPLIAHMAKQVPRDRRAFGAMLLLERVVKRLRRRRRIKDPLLLLLRVLAIAAAVLAVAGARVSYPGGVPEFGGSGKVVVLVDESMSMSLSDGGSTLLQRARNDATKLVQDLPDTALVGLVVYGTDAQRLTPALTTDHERVLARLADIQPGYGTSNLRGALLEARRLLGGEKGEVVVFTDEAGAQMIPEAATELRALVDAGSAVIPRPELAEPPRNVAITKATYGEGIEGGQVTLTIANYGPDPVEVPCEVTLPDGAKIPVFADLTGNAESDEKITVPPEAKGGVGKAVCEDRDLSLDDARYFQLPRVGASRVLVVDGDPGDTPTRSEVYFLERALAPWGALQTSVKPDVTTPMGLMGLDPQVHRVVFLSNVADPRPFGPLLTEFVRHGGNLVITAGDNVTADRYNAALGAILPTPILGTRDLADPGEPGIPLQLPDTTHPLFAPFARGGRTGFSKVRTNRVIGLEPYAESDDVHTLLRYENGVPALVDRKVGSGHCLVWTSSIDLQWTSLPLQAVFMPLVQRTVGWLGGESGGTEARFDATVGDHVTVPLPDLAVEPDVVGPDGQKVRSRVDGSNLVFVPEQPGAYVLQVESAPPLAYVAVNTPPEESDVRRYDSLAKAEAALDPALFTKTLDLGPGLLGVALGLMAITGVLATRPADA